MRKICFPVFDMHKKHHSHLRMRVESEVHRLCSELQQCLFGTRCQVPMPAICLIIRGSEDIISY